MKKVVIKKNRYVDSVSLMGVADRVMTLSGVTNAESGMGTAANRDILESLGYVLPEDISEMYIPVINHRITLSQEAKRSFLSAEQVLENILKSTDMPRRSKGRI